MNFTKNSERIALIAGEFTFGVLLSVIYFGLDLANDKFWGDSYLSGIIRYHGGLSIVFFASVLSIGIWGAIKFQQSGKIARAISYSVLCWFFSLVVYAMTFSFFSFSFNLRLVHLYIILAGIIAGFNLGLYRNARSKTGTG